MCICVCVCMHTSVGLHWLECVWVHVPYAGSSAKPPTYVEGELESICSQQIRHYRLSAVTRPRQRLGEKPKKKKTPKAQPALSTWPIDPGHNCRYQSALVTSNGCVDVYLSVFGSNGWEHLNTDDTVHEWFSYSNQSCHLIMSLWQVLTSCFHEGSDHLPPSPLLSGCCSRTVLLVCDRKLSQLPQVTLLRKQELMVEPRKGSNCFSKYVKKKSLLDFNLKGFFTNPINSRRWADTIFILYVFYFLIGIFANFNFLHYTP